MEHYLRQCRSRCPGRGSGSSIPSAGAAKVRPGSLSLNEIMLKANQKGRAGEVGVGGGGACYKNH